MRTHRRFVYPVVILLLCCNLVGCDNLVAPLSSSSRESFADSSALTEQIEVTSDAGSMTASLTGDETVSSTQTMKSPSRELTIWANNSDIRALALVYQEANPDVAVTFEYAPDPYYEASIVFPGDIFNAVGTGEVPDVYCVSEDYLKKFVDDHYFDSLESLRPQTELVQTYPSVLDMGTSSDGILRALSCNVYSGAMFYRRSLAKEYFGTDDPEEVQKYFCDMDQLLLSAEIIKEKSDGRTLLMNSGADLFDMFAAAREQPWIIDGRLQIPPSLQELMDISLQMSNSGFTASWDHYYVPYSNNWMATMQDHMNDESYDRPFQVFSYFLPSWGYAWLAAEINIEYSYHAPVTTTGDWAAIPGPIPFDGGGETYLGIMQESKNKEEALRFIEFVTLNEQTLANIFTGVYTNDYLKRIDPEIEPDLAISGGSMVSSATVMADVMDRADPEIVAFFGDQNPYEVYDRIAREVRVPYDQKDDWKVEHQFLYMLCYGYPNDGLSKEEALRSFYASVKAEYPEIEIPDAGE